MEVILDNDGISSPSQPEDLLLRSEQIQHEDYDFKFSFYINKGFKLFFKRPGEFIGYLVVMMLISALGAIPFIGILVSLTVSGPLAVGWYIVAHKTDKDEPVIFSDFFGGFQKKGLF